MISTIRPKNRNPPLNMGDHGLLNALSHSAVAMLAIGFSLVVVVKEVCIVPESGS